MTKSTSNTANAPFLLQFFEEVLQASEAKQPEASLGTKTVTKVSDESSDDDFMKNALANATKTVTRVRNEESDADFAPHNVRNASGTHTVTNVGGEQSDTDPSHLGMGRDLWTASLL